MPGFKPVTISKGSFAFCRAMVAIILWLAVVLRSIPLIAVVLGIMILSALLKVRRAPLIVLYKYTIDRIWRSDGVVVDEIGIFVSHVTGAVFGAICLALLLFTNSFVGWIVTAVFALLQTSAACGFCSALKLYNCWAGGTCCRFGKYAKKVRDNARQSR